MKELCPWEMTIVVFGKKSNKVTTTIMIVWGLSTRLKTLPKRRKRTTHYMSLGNTHLNGTKNHPFSIVSS
jgi:hypothetical protein